jgi:hypothetical protein
LTGATVCRRVLPKRGDSAFWEKIMGLLVWYVVLMILGDIAAYLIGLAVEHYWPSASLAVFLFLYFLFLWVSWVLAVWLTEPKAATAEPAAAPPAKGSINLGGGR